MMRMDQSRALALAAEASERWQAGSLDEADEGYREALAIADPHHYRTPDIYGQYAAFLTSMHRMAEAGPHYEKALQLELRNDPNEASPAVVTARYFLGEYYLAMGEADSARRVVAPSLLAAEKPLAWLVEAEALALSGARGDARAAAERAVALAANAEQRERIRSRLSELFED
jgi:tetratricopeptide (TPR) repeat protein